MNFYKNLFLTVLLIQFSLVFSAGPQQNSNQRRSRLVNRVLQSFFPPKGLDKCFQSDSPVNGDSDYDKWPLTSESGEPIKINNTNFDIVFPIKISSVLSTQNKKKTMEDFYIRLEPYGIFAIMDGHSGSIAAARTQELLIKMIVDHMNKGEREFEKCLPDIIAKVEADLKATYLAKKKENSSHIDDGTTLCLVVAQQLKLTVANVGDSRAVLYDKNGKMLKQTRDHKVSDPIERKRIEDEGFGTQSGRIQRDIAIARSLGDMRRKIDKKYPLLALPEVTIWNLNSNTKFFVLASDGLWDVMSVKKVSEIVCAHLTDNDYGAQVLLDKAIEYISRDNIAVIVVILQDGVYKVGRSSTASASASTPSTLK